MCLCSLVMCPQVGEIKGHGKGKDRRENGRETQRAELQERNSATEHKDSKINRKKERLISGPKNKKANFRCVSMCVYTLVSVCFPELDVFL